MNWNNELFIKKKKQREWVGVFHIFWWFGTKKIFRWSQSKKKKRPTGEDVEWDKTPEPNVFFYSRFVLLIFAFLMYCITDTPELLTNKDLRWCILQVPVTHNGWWLLCSRRCRAKPFQDKFLVSQFLSIWHKEINTFSAFLLNIYYPFLIAYKNSLENRF